MSGCRLDADRMGAHVHAVAGLGEQVRAAASAAGDRLGAADLGLLFASTLTPWVNRGLGAVADAIERHGAELADHADDLRRTLDLLQVTDGAGAAVISSAELTAGPDRAGP